MPTFPPSRKKLKYLENKGLLHLSNANPKALIIALKQQEMINKNTEACQFPEGEFAFTIILAMGIILFLIMEMM